MKTKSTVIFSALQNIFGEKKKCAIGEFREEREQAIAESAMAALFFKRLKFFSVGEQFHPPRGSGAVRRPHRALPDLEGWLEMHGQVHRCHAQALANIIESIESLDIKQTCLSCIFDNKFWSCMFDKQLF